MPRQPLTHPKAAWCQPAIPFPSLPVVRGPAYVLRMNAAVEITHPPTLLSKEAGATARALIRQFPECFWFWDRNTAIETVEDARLVVQNLREYGGHRAWREAQRLHSCL